jgi:hypothetical protein
MVINIHQSGLHIQRYFRLNYMVHVCYIEVQIFIVNDFSLRRLT